MIPTGLLGGSFNPAHGGHRAISLNAIDALGLDELWWLVSPGNPLKPAKGMAPLSARLAAAQRMRSEEHTSELQSLMRISFAVFCLKIKNHTHSGLEN